MTIQSAGGGMEAEVPPPLPGYHPAAVLVVYYTSPSRLGAPVVFWLGNEAQNIGVHVSSTLKTFILGFHSNVLNKLF